MNKQDLLVSGVVAVACAGILVLFTDIEMDVVRWINCSPMADPTDRQSSFCQGHGPRKGHRP
jgi:hypothetical protein